MSHKKHDLTESEVSALMWLMDVWDELKHMAKTDEALAENLATAQQIVNHNKIKQIREGN